jgi:hypothetical protein
MNTIIRRRTGATKTFLVIGVDSEFSGPLNTDTGATTINENEIHALPDFTHHPADGFNAL